MRGTEMRKNQVYRHINAMPADERDAARMLYGELDRLEFATVQPWILASYLTVVMFYLAYKYFGSIMSIHWAIPVTAVPVFYLVGVALFKYGVFRRHRIRHMSKARDILRLSPANRRIFDKLLGFDPDMARNIKGCLAQLQQ